MAHFILKFKKIFGYSAGNAKHDGYTASDLKDAGYAASELRGAGYRLDELREGGYTAQEVFLLGYPAYEMKASGYTVSEFRASGFTASYMKEAGYTLNELKINGYTAKELKTAEYTANELRDVDFTLNELKAAGYAPNHLKNAGYTANELKEVGYSAGALKAVGYRLDELRAAGYLAGELRDAGYFVGELRAVGYSVYELKMGGYFANELRDAGYFVYELREGGYTAAELRDAGYTLADLRVGDYTAYELRIAGYLGYELRPLGYLLNELKAAGYTASDMKRAGYSAIELKSVSYSLDELKKAGYSVEQLRDARYSVYELKAAGYSWDEMKAAGFPADELKHVGFSLDESKDATYTEEEVSVAALTVLNRHVSHAENEVQDVGSPANEERVSAALSNPQADSEHGNVSGQVDHSGMIFLTPSLSAAISSAFTALTLKTMHDEKQGGATIDTAVKVGVQVGVPTVLGSVSVGVAAAAWPVTLALAATSVGVGLLCGGATLAATCYYNKFYVLRTLKHIEESVKKLHQEAPFLAEHKSLLNLIHHSFMLVKGEGSKKSDKKIKQLDPKILFNLLEMKTILSATESEWAAKHSVQKACKKMTKEIDALLQHSLLFSMLIRDVASLKELYQGVRLIKASESGNTNPNLQKILAQLTSNHLNTKIATYDGLLERFQQEQGSKGTWHSGLKGIISFVPEKKEWMHLHEEVIQMASELQRDYQEVKALVPLLQEQLGACTLERSKQQLFEMHALLKTLSYRDALEQHVVSLTRNKEYECDTEHEVTYTHRH